jgi:phosphotriesterase-related protein
MAKINGVLGTIDTKDLGFTLMHEHILVGSWSMRQAFHDWVDADALIEDAAQELRAAKGHGVQTIVEVTPINLGRDIHVIREVAARADMPIIAATGLFGFDKVSFESWEFDGWPADRLVEFLIRDIESGIQGTNSKAGIIKASDGHKSLQVAARLHLATGLPITTHTSPMHRTGLAQQDVFEKEGVDLRRVVIGHCGCTDHVEYLEEILQRGSFIGMDRFGAEMILSNEKRIGTVAELCRRGWSDRMVLSHDRCSYLEFFPKEMHQTLAPHWNFYNIPTQVIPALRQAGVSDEQVYAMTVANPARVFDG